jgi:hypothetical protein
MRFDRSFRNQTTIPGLGCGEFAGDVIDAVCAVYPDIINEIIQENIGRFPNIGAFYIASPGAQSRKNIEGESDVLFGDPLSNPQQLDAPDRHSKKYVGHKPYKVVAADHASWPCNDWYVASRWTDEGVIGAATSAMQAMTGVEGVYSGQGFNPPSGYANWEDVVKRNQLALTCSLSTMTMVNVGTHQAGPAAGAAADGGGGGGGGGYVQSHLAGLFGLFKQASVDTQQRTSYINFSQLADDNYFIKTSNIADATRIAQKLADIGIQGGRGNKFPGPHAGFTAGTNPTGIILTPANIKMMMGADRDSKTIQESIEETLVSMLSLDKQIQRMGAAAAEITEQSSFKIEDNQGDNWVKSVRKNSDSSFTVIGENALGQERRITLFQDGAVSGYNKGRRASELGFLEGKMYELRKDIFDHFDLDLSEAAPRHSGPRLGL